MSDVPVRPEPSRRSLAEALARKRVPSGFVCGVALLWLARPTSLSLAIGGAIAVTGELLRIWAAGHLEKAREVTSSGPYRITRHPLYLGSAVIGVGAAVAAANPSVAMLIALYLVVTITSAIRTEEANMRREFGDEYLAYMDSRATAVDRPFSLARAIKNKEHRAVAGLALAGAVLALKVAF